MIKRRNDIDEREREELVSYQHSNKVDNRKMEGRRRGINGNAKNKRMKMTWKKNLTKRAILRLQRGLHREFRVKD